MQWVKFSCGYLGFWGWCPHGKNPARPMIIGGEVGMIEGVCQSIKCHTLEDPYANVPQKNMKSCPVL